MYQFELTIEQIRVLKEALLVAELQRKKEGIEQPIIDLHLTIDEQILKIT